MRTRTRPYRCCCYRHLDVFWPVSFGDGPRLLFSWNCGKSLTATLSSERGAAPLEGAGREKDVVAWDARFACQPYRGAAHSSPAQPLQPPRSLFSQRHFHLGGSTLKRNAALVLPRSEVQPRPPLCISEFQG